MSDDPIDKVVNGEAWNEFCDLLKKAGEVVLREDLDTSAFDRGEGLRYLSRLLRCGFYSFAEGTGPLHPEFRTMPDLVKMGLDNPDNYYVSASVNARYRYRIRGNRGTIHYLGIAAQSQNFARKDRIAGGAGHLNDADLHLDADGNFEILASREKPDDLGGANWLEMSEATTQILIRQTFLDRANEQPVDVSIECLDQTEPAGRRSIPARVPGQLMGSAMYAIGCAQWFADWVLEFEKKGETQRVPPAGRGEPSTGRRRPEHRAAARHLEARARRGAGDRGGAPRVPLLELPARQHLGRVARLPNAPRAPEQRWRVGAGRRRRGDRRRAPRPGPSELDGHRRPRSRHDGLPLGPRRPPSRCPSTRVVPFSEIPKRP